VDNNVKNTEKCYKDIKEYEVDIVNVIKNMILKNERLVFAIIAERAGITRFVIREYPELRNYILNEMAFRKELKEIDKKIERAVAGLQKSKKSITFMSIASKCKFDGETIYQNQYIKDKIREILIDNKRKN
jgi:hypothetical protein